MAIVELLNQDMKQAMKNKNKLKLGVIRMVKASMQNEAINLKKDALSEEEELTILARELKQRRDSLHEFKEAGREDLVSQLEDEIKIIQAYMPEQLSDQELEQIVVETIGEVQAQSKKDMGKVMSALMPKVKGKAEGSRVNQLVQKNLS
ncbi:transamidase GatB domain protein [Gracilibacillus boraciitolerans JCM 21714]|uniref:Transamidase GatB domain protein n=1 Tax=Gracilibacillus boraciitolerans JCM 21714 TaxID=1298598 RepID=W4VD69_9BACI|nr:GatB/YqeY domain-containing protein [Gracilibacillus boraciitolerans]GAE91147.1 transamidase GatB domain protein [Gracilibacillus boraciitolerans JCM 21714]